jgi:hypothetical protein
MKSSWFVVPLLVLAAVWTFAATARSQFAHRPPLVRLSADPFTNGGAEHATEVEPDTFAHGMTIVSAFQTGRYADGGSSDIGFATSLDGGATWTSGFLPGISKGQNPSNPYQRVSDPAVVYDLKHREWLINSLPVPTNPAALVSRSKDGVNWGPPIVVAAAPIGSDKNWITCDNTRSSPYFGNCYVEWDDGNGSVHVNTSSDGGKTWGATKSAANASGLGGQPLAQPNGTVVVPFTDGYANMWTIVSTDGGQTWSSAIQISVLANHFDAQMRSPALPSAQVDGAGNIYVAWADCGFRSGCKENDIVISQSSDGVHWSPKVRVPIDAVTSTVDHFLPGLGVDPATSGGSAHLALEYYYFPQTSCTASTCKLYTAYVTSHDGGQTWSASTTLAGPVRVDWLANAGGRFVGDYGATAFTSDGLAHATFAVGTKKSGTVYDEGMYTTVAGLPVALQGAFFSSRFDRLVPGVRSDHGRLHYPPRSRNAANREFEKD